MLSSRTPQCQSSRALLKRLLFNLSSLPFVDRLLSSHQSYNNFDNDDDAWKDIYRPISSDLVTSETPEVPHPQTPPAGARLVTAVRSPFQASKTAGGSSTGTPSEVILRSELPNSVDLSCSSCGPMGLRECAKPGKLRKQLS